MSQGPTKWNKTKCIELHTSMQMDTHKQKLTKESGALKKSLHAQIEKLQAELNEKNTYMGHFHTSKARNEKHTTMKAKQAVSRNISYSNHIQEATHFDKVHEMDREPCDMIKYSPAEYCQKCKYESKWCKHRCIRDSYKDQQTAIVTT